MSDDLIKRLECGVATRAQVMGGFTFDIPATGEMIREAAAALLEAQATIARQQVMLDRALENNGSLMIENARMKEALTHIGLYAGTSKLNGNAAAQMARAALPPREGEVRQ